MVARPDLLKRTIAMSLLICYDISEDKLREKVAKNLIAAGFSRIQFSVFAGDTGEKYFEDMLQELQHLMTNFAQPSDSILLFDITDAQIHNCIVIGRDALDRDALTGDQHTLIL